MMSYFQLHYILDLYTDQSNSCVSRKSILLPVTFVEFKNPDNVS